MYPLADSSEERLNNVRHFFTCPWSWPTGAGRCLSRTAATKAARGRNISKELAAAGLIANSRSREGLAEEQPAANKDVDVVVNVMHRAGRSLKVTRLRPLGLIKG